MTATPSAADASARLAPLTTLSAMLAEGRAAAVADEIEAARRAGVDIPPGHRRVEAMAWLRGGDAEGVASRGFAFLREQPAETAFASQLAAALLATRGRDAVAALFEAELRAVPDDAPMPVALLLETNRLSGIETVRTFVESTGRAGPLRRLAGAAVTVLELLARPGLAIAHLCEPVRGAPRPLVEIALLLADPTRFAGLDDADLAARGVRLDRFAGSSAHVVPPAIERRLAKASFIAEAPRARAANAERWMAYQGHALEHGTLTLDDVYGEGTAELLGSATHYDKIVYVLRGAGDQMMVCGTTLAQVLGLHLPAEGVFVHVAAARPASLAPHVWAGLVAWLACTTIERMGTGRVALPPAPPRRRVVARGGGAENFAHHVWNNHGGFEKAIALGLADRIDEVRWFGSEFFGPFAAIYPELADVPFRHDARPAPSAEHLFDTAVLPLPLTSFILWREATERVVRVAQARGPSPAAAPVLEAARAGGPNLYVALRVGDKAWADADVELPRLIEHFVAEHPTGRTFLDGFTVPAGRDHASASWTAQRDELDRLVATIRTGAGTVGTRMESLMGLDMLDSILIAREAAAYVAPLGTAHHKIDWFSDVSGVVYAARPWADKPLDGLPGMGQREGAGRAVLVFGEADDPASVRVRNSLDRRPQLANLRCDWRTVWEPLKAILDGRR